MLGILAIDRKLLSPSIWLSNAKVSEREAKILSAVEQAAVHQVPDPEADTARD